MELRDVVQHSPLLFPLNWDKSGQAIQCVRLDEQQYSAASFLDQRLLESGRQAALIPWTEWESAARGLAPRCNFIFHISHSGSTLVSRLLGLHPQVFSLREPTILRWMAQGSFQERLPLFLGVWSRVFRSEQTALIKATSFVSDIGGELLGLVPNSRAALLFVPLATFLPAQLDGGMHDITSQLDVRRARLSRYLPGVELSSMTAGEAVAASWLVEVLALQEIHRDYPERTLWLDFEWLLTHREQSLVMLCELLGIAKPSPELFDSPLWNHYAKRPEVQYDMQFRDQLIRQSATNYAAEVAKGMEWVHSFADRLPREVVQAIGTP